MKEQKDKATIPKNIEPFGKAAMGPGRLILPALKEADHDGHELRGFPTFPPPRGLTEAGESVILKSVLRHRAVSSIGRASDS
jgi:hypothetical protein